MWILCSSVIFIFFAKPVKFRYITLSIVLVFPFHLDIDWMIISTTRNCEPFLMCVDALSALLPNKTIGIQVVLLSSLPLHFPSLCNCKRIFCINSSAICSGLLQNLFLSIRLDLHYSLFNSFLLVEYFFIF
ncbi:hypothetical protein DS746_p50 (plasmid) [Campylobacter jejuni]|nr:hypothetical protein DS746_p50 [Campylobacter jejuni]